MTPGENRLEQAKILTLITEAIPVGVHFNNIVVVLAELTAEYARGWYQVLVNEAQRNEAKEKQC